MRHGDSAEIMQRNTNKLRKNMQTDRLTGTQEDRQAARRQTDRLSERQTARKPKNTTRRFSFRQQGARGLSFAFSFLQMQAPMMFSLRCRREIGRALCEHLSLSSGGGMMTCQQSIMISFVSSGFIGPVWNLNSNRSCSLPTWELISVSVLTVSAPSLPDLTCVVCHSGTSQLLAPT